MLSGGRTNLQEIVLLCVPHLWDGLHVKMD
jgi:hypothetical protein